MILLIKNIKELVQIENEPVAKVCGNDMATLNTIENAFLLIQDDKIVSFGPMADLEKPETWAMTRCKADSLYGAEIKQIDATGKMVFPSYCDSHTHLVYAGSREIEYIDKIKGLSYEEIAQRGGGILNSAKLLRETPEDSLYEQSMERVREIISLGTGAVEIKSGYGLTPEAELKMLRVAKRIKETAPLIVKTTFLGAHSIPAEYKSNQGKYVDIVINDMLPQVAEEELADYIDVFCDRGFFTVDETARILEAAAKYGLRPKIHANELDYSGGIQVGVKYNALSVDHLEYVGEDEITALQNSQTMPTILPGAAFFLNMKYSPAREMMEAGLPVALASDYNPGSSPSGNMKFVQSLGCINYKMTPEEVIHATTLNTAYAMGVSDIAGSIAAGKKANVFISKPIPSYSFMPYAYGSHLVDTVILNGEVWM